MAKPKLALIPAAQGTKLYSVLPSDGTGDFDFTRGSVATRINAQGLIENVASGQSRLNYPLIDGVQKGCPHHILEPQRLQKIQYSEAVNSMTLNSVSVVADNIISPDGTLNADKLTPISTGFKTVGNFVSSVIGSVYTISFFYKNVDHTNIGFYDNNTSGSEISINLKTNVFSLGSVVTDGGVEYYGNGWYRAYATFSASASTISNYLIFRNEANSGSYLGDGTSMYAWGFQVEEGSYLTSYIPNNGNAAGVTRSSETATGAGNSTTFNDSEGVLMAEISALADDVTTRRIALSNSANNTLIRFEYSTSSNRMSALVFDGSAKLNVFSDAYNIQTSNKLAIKYKSGDNSFFINGFKVDGNNNSISMSALSDLSFDDGTGTQSYFHGKTKQLQYFNSALADTQLEQLTSWVSFQEMANGQLYTIE